MENETILPLPPENAATSKTAKVTRVFNLLTDPHNKKGNLITLLGITATLLLLAFFGILTNKNRTGQEEIGSQPSSSEIKKTVYKNVVPPHYPPQIPFQKDAKIVQSYSKEYPSTMYQMSTLHSSEGDLSKNFSFYKNFMNQDGWVIITASTSERMSFIQALKGKDVLEIIIRKRPEFTESSSTSAIVDSKILSYIIINVFRK